MQQMEKHQLVEKFEGMKKTRMDLELYVNYLLTQKFLWKKVYDMTKNMVHSNTIDISARIQRVSNQYDFLLSLTQEIQDQAEAAILSNIQLGQVNIKIKEIKDKIEDLANLPKLRRALEFYEGI